MKGFDSETNYTTHLKEKKDTCIHGQTGSQLLWTMHAWIENHPIRLDSMRIPQHASWNMELEKKEVFCIHSICQSAHFKWNNSYEQQDCWSVMYGNLMDGTNTCWVLAASVISPQNQRQSVCVPVRSSVSQQVHFIRKRTRAFGWNIGNTSWT